MIDANLQSSSGAAATERPHLLHDAPSAGPHHASMVLIPAGCFRMGSEQGSPAERPEHTVDLPDFWLDSTPVTNQAFAGFIEDSDYQTEVERAGSAWGFQDGEFKSVMGMSWRTFATPDRVEHPVILITWNDAVAYCSWAGLRLPSEAEWERAARGGVVSAAFPWGDANPDGTQSNFASDPHGPPGTTPVTRHAPNQFGLYDIVGNVWQWCSDWYSETYYAASPKSEPSGPASGTTRIRRGGAWNVIQPFRLRCANRGAMIPSQTATNMGFRCARSR
jgi:sulfatase modifying factor 1